MTPDQIQKILDKLNSFLTKTTLREDVDKLIDQSATGLSEKDFAALQVIKNQKLGTTKIPKADLYDEQDVKNMYNNFLQSVNQKWSADTGQTIDAAFPLGFNADSAINIFANLFEYGTDSEGEPIKNQERDPLSPEYASLSLYEKIAWNTLSDLETFINRFPTHATKGRQYRDIVKTLEKEKKISTELKNALLKGIGTEEMLNVAEEYRSDLFNKLNDINNEIFDQSGDYLKATNNLVSKTTLDDMVKGNSVFPRAITQNKLLKEQVTKDLVNQLTNQELTDTQFFKLVDNIFTRNGIPLGNKTSKDPYEKQWIETINNFKNLFFEKRNDLLTNETLDPLQVGEDLYKFVNVFIEEGNIEELVAFALEEQFQADTLDEKSAKSKFDNLLFQIGIKKQDLLPEDYDASLIQMRNYSNITEFSEWFAKNIDKFQRKKQNVDISSKPVLLKNELIKLLNPTTEAYRRHLENNVLTDPLIKFFADTISKDPSVPISTQLNIEVIKFNNDPTGSDIGRLFTGLDPTDFDEQRTIERIGTLEQQINLGYDPATNTWDTRAGLLPKSPLSALDVGPDVTEDELLQAYDELAGGDERFFRYLSAISPQLKSQFSNEWKSLRGDPGLTLEERRIQQGLDQGRLRIEDVDPALYKNLQDKLSGTYGQVASKIFSDISTGRQTDSAQAKKLIQSVGIPTPDPTKILSQLETEGIALTEGQRKVLLDSGTPGVTVTEGALQAENLAAYATKPSLTFTDYLKGRRKDLQRDYSLTLGQTPQRQAGPRPRAFTTTFTRGRT